ncbi:MAG: TIGR00282 family metallophosphoesterase [Endomicrobiales bacterium]|nr:TIGR00282 family metallophosphoesterase [Endomicrobiales bacterium]
MFKVLFIADIVGKPGRIIIKDKLPEMIESEQPDFVIANAENSAGGKGLTEPVATELFDAGINVLTLGNHAFDRKEVEQIIDNKQILRPANYPSNVPGKGWNVYTTKNGVKLAVVNVMGRVYMPLLDCPFLTINNILEKIHPLTRNIIVDFHAEITSEKQTFGWFLDGRVSAVLGTHTHIPTADEKILPDGTAYITDTGMTGPSEGIIGMDREIIIKKYITGVPHHFVVAKGPSIMQGAIVEIDTDSGKAASIKRFSILG